MAQTRGTATDILNADIQAMAKALAATPGGDELLGVSSINNGEYNVGVAVVHRAKAANIQASLAHHQITEVYHVLSGAGTMVSGGTMDNPRETTDVHTIAVVGPSARGGKLAGGQSRKIGAGDVVVIPPDTPHGWSDVSEDLVYLVVRMDRRGASSRIERRLQVAAGPGGRMSERMREGPSRMSRPSQVAHPGYACGSPRRHGHSATRAIGARRRQNLIEVAEAVSHSEIRRGPAPCANHSPARRTGCPVDHRRN